MRATSSRSVSVSTVGPTTLQCTGSRGTRGTRRTRRKDSSANSAGSAVSALIVVSLGVVDRARLPNDGHFDLARVFELVLDAARDVLREPDGLLVRDLLALDHDADLAAGLQRERLRHALEGVGDAFQLLEPLHVGLEDVAARAG